MWTAVPLFRSTHALTTPAGLMDGMGVISFPSKDTFTGMWQLGQRVSGTWTFNSGENGIVFTESWVDGAPGTSPLALPLDLITAIGPVGQLVFSNGGKYTGEVGHAVVGKYTIKNYQIFRSGYVRSFICNVCPVPCSDGIQGEMVWADNTRYIGGWKKDKRKGFGTETVHG